MREFEYVFDMGLKHGLRRNKRFRTSGQTLVSCHNFIIGDDGLEPYVSKQPISAWTATSDLYGFPRVHTGDRENYLLAILSGAGKIYTIASNTTISLSYTFPTVTPGTATPASIEWIDVADFGEYIVFSTTNGCVARNVQEDTWTELATWTHAYQDSFPALLTCCNFRGQLVGGGMNSDFPVIDPFAPTPITYYLTNKHVVFSDIGSINMFVTRRNEAGNHYIPTNGQVRKVLPLLNHVIVYTDDSVWALTPVITPVPGYRKTKIYNAGIEHPRQVDGDEFNHVAVVNNGRVIKIDNELKVINLGYEEYFPLPSFVHVVVDKEYREWILNRANVGAYYLTKKGLSTVYQYTHGLLGGTNFSVGTDMSETRGIIKTDLTDFGMKGVKTITGIEVGGDYPKMSGTVTVYSQYDTEGDRSATISSLLNEHGTVGMPASGEQFYIEISFPSYVGVYIDFIKVRWKMSDMRFLRGVYSPPPRGQYVS